MRTGGGGGCDAVNHRSQCMGEQHVPPGPDARAHAAGYTTHLDAEVRNVLKQRDALRGRHLRHEAEVQHTDLAVARADEVARVRVWRVVVHVCVCVFGRWAQQQQEQQQQQQQQQQHTSAGGGCARRHMTAAPGHADHTGHSACRAPLTPACRRPVSSSCMR
jgi:hypothetical protein